MTSCRWCARPDLEAVLDLGLQPPADLFPLPGDPVPVSPLRMGRCPGCGLAQLLEDPGTVEEPLGIEPDAMLVQARAAVAAATAAGLAGPGRTFAEFDSPHGGSWRTLLTAGGSTDVTDDPGVRADLVVDVFGLMHDADQRAALARRVARLAPGGTLALQYHPLETIVAGGQWNALRHGHMAYYSHSAIDTMLTAAGLRFGRSWTFPLYGGTTLHTATLSSGASAPEPAAGTAQTDTAQTDTAQTHTVQTDTAQTHTVQTDTVQTDAAQTRTAHRLTRRSDGEPDLRALAAAVDHACAALREWLVQQRDAGRTVLGYGAASRAVPLLNRAAITPELLPGVVDAAPRKWGRVIPGMGITILAPARLVERPPEWVLLFVPDLLQEVRRAYPQVEAAGGAWMVCEPELRVVPPELRVVPPELRPA